MFTQTFSFLVHDKPSSHTEILVRREHIAISIKRTEAHPIWMCFQNLVPTPEHVTIHIIGDAMMTTQKQSLIVKNSLITSRYGACVDGLWVRSCVPRMLKIGSSRGAIANLPGLEEWLGGCDGYADVLEVEIIVKGK
jgi:hypothetical protein